MAHFVYSKVGIKALSVAVPKNIYENKNDNPFFSRSEIENIIKKTGIERRRVAENTICASDLCFSAATSLLAEMNTDRSEVDILIFVTQTPDYRMPGSGIILQHRLGLGNRCAAFDISLGCSGFIYGLNTAFSLASQAGIRKVLLLNGETRSKVYSMKDKKTGLLFGDAGSACLIEKTETETNSYFSLLSDGSKSHYIKIPAGGYRNPSSIDTLRENQYEDGSIRTEEQGVMDGAAVFDFTIREIPRNIMDIMNFAQVSVDELDFFVLHQANRFINNHIGKKLGVPPEKLPFSLDRYGNTSSVSIPLTIVSEIAEQISSHPLRLLLSGFGVGLSWGSAIVETDCPFVGKIIEV